MNEMLSMVLPAYNEVKNIKEVVDSILKFVPTFFENYEVIIVDDGSKDGTGSLIDNLATEHNKVVAVHHDCNRGYGATLRTGFEAAKGELIFFTDADGQFDIRELPKLIILIEEGADIACGWRIKRADPFVRRLNARIYRIIVRLLFGLNVKDINCAFKLFTRKVMQDIELQSSGAFINSEFLILAKNKGYTIREVGITHFPRRKGKQTGNSIIVVLQAFRELARFWRRKKHLKGEIK